MIDTRTLRDLDVAYARFNAARTLSDPRPSAFRVEHHGEALMTIDPARADQPYYNRILGMRHDRLDALDAMMDRLRAAGVAPRVDLRPEDVDAATSRALNGQGLGPVAALSYLGTDPQTCAPVADDIRVDRWHDTEADRFLDLLELSSSPIDPSIRADRRVHYCTDRFRQFVAFLDDEPVGWATTFVDGATCLLGNAFTFDRFRGRGVQSALLAERLRDAAGLGVRHAVCDVEPATTSERNARRAGMDLVTIVTIWEVETTDRASVGGDRSA